VPSKHNIETIGLLPMKVSSLLQPIKDGVALKTVGIYSIPCKCGENQMVISDRFNNFMKYFVSRKCLPLFSSPVISTA
jgi:hypothetical protein